MKIILKKNLQKNGYLLIIAALLYAISFINIAYKSYRYSPHRVQKQLNGVIANKEKSILPLINDSVFIAKLLQGDDSISEKFLKSYKDVGLYIYTIDSPGHFNLVHWNSNEMIPEIKDLIVKDGSFATVHVNGYFEFLKKSHVINNKAVVACGMVPIYWNYGINNKYLHSKFSIAGIGERYTIAKTDTKIKLTNGEEKNLFSLQEKENVPSKDMMNFFLRMFAIIFLSIYINILSLDILRSKDWATGFLFLFGFLFLLRFITYLIPFQFKYITFPLFDSTIYGSNFLHPTLGDLLINVVLVYWIISFVKSSVIKSLQKLKPVTGIYAWVFTIASTALLVLITFTSTGIISSLIKDSQISFDVTNYFSLSIFSFLSFIILCFITLSFFHISHIFIFCLNKVQNLSPFSGYFFITIFSLAYFTFTLQNPSTVSNIIVLIWLLAYISIMHFRVQDMLVPIFRSTFFILWIIFFSLSISALIIYQNSKVNDLKRVREAEKLATEADKNAQYIFSTGIADIDSAFLTANLSNIQNQSTNKAIKDSLSSRYLSTNSEAYDTHIYTFDENETPLHNDDLISYDALQNLINGGHETIAPDLYYFEKDLNVFSFIYQKELRDAAGNFKGYFFIVADPKKYKSRTVYPELFMPGNAVDAQKNITYAIYNRGKLVENSGDYNFRANIPVSQYPKGQQQVIYSDDWAEFRYNAGNGKLIVTVYSQPFFLEFITLFAYLFVAFLLISFFFQTGRLLVLFQFNFPKIRRGFIFKIKNQIQAAIVFISVFSFLIIGISTITFYIKRFNQNNRERLIKTMKVLSSEVQDNVDSKNLFFGSAIVFGSDDNRKLQKVINEIAELHGVDVNMYGLNGNLLATTRPEIYKKQILSNIMDPNAFDKLVYQKEIQFTHDEKVSGFSFLSIYSPIFNKQGEPSAYINIPYLDTQKELNQEISNFLVTLINLNAFIFLIAGAISVLLTNRITSSFSLIADKMKKINLGTTNEKINWNSNDEIGVLVNEYNKMVNKLEESAVALAKSEREGAWQEMARQVAHEIKNPLTPMKLSIQYLQKAIQEKKPNTEALSKKVSDTLVEQIDQLAKIASDFSQFANITKIKSETFDVTDLLMSLVDLYSSNERVQINYTPLGTVGLIMADRSQISRLFTNLFQNAIEASEHRNTVLINISQEIEEQQLLIHFADNGSGIPVNKLNKIFTPNFTTKSSGTGLGLAISKGIVENANGKIWFDTEEGEGTTFHILLPMVSDV